MAGVDELLLDEPDPERADAIDARGLDELDEEDVLPPPEAWPPVLMFTAATVPSIGVTSWALARLLWAVTSWASADATPAWSDWSCAGVTLASSADRAFWALVSAICAELTW